jgi:putative tryptophan/tyrosine transport system substrate-binding protein
MRRRAFIAGLGGVAVWPAVARGQSIPVIGLLSSERPAVMAMRLEALRRGLAEAGYTENVNVRVEYRWAEDNHDRLNGLALELVQLRVSVIVSLGDPAAQAAKRATRSIPILFVAGGDPVQSGLVASLQNPGANITGVTVLNIDMTPKRLQLLNELVPSATRIAALLDPTARNFDFQSGQLTAAAAALGVGVDVVNASSLREIEQAFGTVSQRRNGAMVIGASVRFNGLSEQIGALSLRYAVPAIYQTREFVVAGGLATYGGSVPDAWRLLAVYCARIIRGELPQSLPVQQITKVEMLINMKTAKKLGIGIPLPILGRADEVIE